MTLCENRPSSPKLREKIRSNRLDLWSRSWNFAPSQRTCTQNDYGPSGFSQKTNTNDRTRFVLTRSCSPSDFFFPPPKFKSSLEGTHFQATKDIRKKTAELLKAVPQNDFRRCFEAWEARMGRYVTSDGNYFEADNM